MGGGGGGTLLLAALLALSPAAVPAQSAAGKTPPAPTIPALLLSDIHFDPYADPAKVAQLNAAPAAEWPAILAAPASRTQAADSAALQAACPVRGTDTSYTLLQSSLKAIHAQAFRVPAPVRFVTISGDLLAHSFDCKYKKLVQSATPAEYVTFTEKTIDYILSSLHTTLPGVPIYTAMGNNDSGCTDYHLDAARDAFLAAVSPLVADALPATLAKAERAAILADFATGGSYNTPLAAVPHTRLIVIDDIFLSPSYQTCAAKPDPAPATAQLAWLTAQLASARQRHEQVWVMGHIPPGVNLYATARKFANICAGAKPQMFLASDSLAEILAKNADLIRLALFGHTHFDELRLLTPEPPQSGAAPGAPRLASETWVQGIPLKIVSSISPVNGNHPTFTLAKIDPATATLVDYTVIEASNLTGIDATWTPEYTYSSAYHQPAFDAASLSNLFTGFQSDPAARTPTSQTYLRSFFPGDLSTLLQLAWPQYTCALTHTSAAAFTTCACATQAAPPAAGAKPAGRP